MASSRSSARRADLLGSEIPRLFTPPLRPLTPKTSLGFALIEFAAEVLGIDLLPWQKWLAIHALELNPDGTFRFRTVVLLVARQNGKSTFLQVLALFFLYVRGVALVIGTAQNLDIAEEVWQGAVDIARDVPELADEIERVTMVNGKKALELRRGERYKVQAANRRGGRGLSGDLVMLDELREHQSWDAWGAVTKTTMARALAQVWAASNAGDAQSVVLASLRARAIASLDGDATDEDDGSLGMFEWSAPDGCDVTDPDGWSQANPSLGHTISAAAIRSALATDPEGVFRTEVLCQWVESLDPPVIDPFLWAGLVADVEQSQDVVFGVEVPLGRGLAVMGAAWRVDGRPHVEVAHMASGTGWVVPWLKKAALLRRVTVVVDRNSEAASLIPELEAEGFEVVKVGGPERAQACGTLYDLANERGITHNGSPLLTDAIASAVWKHAGDGRVFSRRSSDGDISHLYAVTLAHYGLAHVPDYDVLDSVF